MSQADLIPLDQNFELAYKERFGIHGGANQACCRIESLKSVVFRLACNQSGMG